MKALALALSLAAALLGQSATAADDADRPAGIEARHWVPITDRLGFVIVAQKRQYPTVAPSALVPPPEHVSAELMPPEKGYFVLKTPTGWRRLVVAAPTDAG